jgi:hypothetical protein
VHTSSVHTSTTTSDIRHLEDLMLRLLRPTALMVIAVLLGACTAGSPVSTPVSTATATSVEVSAAPTAVASRSAAEPSPSHAAPSPTGSPTAFTSRVYGYSLTVPAGWTTVAAMLAWDGKGMPGHDVAEADQFVGPGSASSWFVGAPTSKDLAGQVKQVIAGTAKDHGDTCPPLPSAQDAITIGSEPATLLSYDCGILINNAVTVHGGKAYVFGFRDEAVHAATDPTDRKTFIDLLKTVQFPD